VMVKLYAGKTEVIVYAIDAYFTIAEYFCKKKGPTFVGPSHVFL